MCVVCVVYVWRGGVLRVGECFFRLVARSLCESFVFRCLSKKHTHDSGMCKASFAGDDAPHSVLPFFSATMPKHLPRMFSLIKNEISVIVLTTNHAV